MDDASSTLQYMVWKEHPDFNVIFEDPMFALIFRTRSFNKHMSLVFCEETLRNTLTTQVIHLKFTLCGTLLSPEDFLLRQLNVIKSWVSGETTTALQFSAVCRELLNAKSNRMFDCEFEKEESIAHTFKSFEFRYPEIWVETDFRALVETLSRFVMSSDLVTAKVKHGEDTQIMTNMPTYYATLLWVKDDGGVMVLIMPEQLSSDADSHYCYTVDSYNERSRETSSMITKTWKQMFGAVPGAVCEEAGVVFFIKNDTIRYIYHRNVNAFDSSWVKQKEQPVFCTPQSNTGMGIVRTYWHESRTEMVYRKVRISDGYNLRCVIETIADSVDSALLISCPRLILYLLLSAVILKYRYSFCSHFASKFFAYAEMFKPEMLHRLLEVWSCFVAGQEIRYCMFTERHADNKYRIYEVELNNVVRGTRGGGCDKVNRLVSWQFIPEENELHVFDTFRPYENGYELLPGDKMGNPYELRTRMGDFISDVLLRIDTVLS